MAMISSQECFRREAEAYRKGRSQLAKVIITTYNNPGRTDKEKLDFLKEVADQDFLKWGKR